MIHTYLDLSTAHITKDTADALDMVGNDGIVLGWPAMTIAPYEYGTFVTVPPLMPDDPGYHDRLPPDLRLVLDHARALGAYVVRFDADGDTVAELPTHDW